MSYFIENFFDQIFPVSDTKKLPRELLLKAKKINPEIYLLAFRQQSEKIKTEELVKTLFSELLHSEVEIQRSSLGKPTIKFPSTTLNFNLSHSKDLLLLAWSFESEVGLDVELLKKDKISLQIVERHFSANEVLEFKKSHEQEQLMFWTLKEAMTKLEGISLFSGFKKYPVTLIPKPHIEGYDVQIVSGVQSMDDDKYLWTLVSRAQK